MAYGARLERGLGFIAPQGFKSPILRRRRGPELSSTGPRRSFPGPAGPPRTSPAHPAPLALARCTSEQPASAPRRIRAGPLHIRTSRQRIRPHSRCRPAHPSRLPAHPAAFALARCTFGHPASASRPTRAATLTYAPSVLAFRLLALARGTNPPARVIPPAHLRPLALPSCQGAPGPRSTPRPRLPARDGRPARGCRPAIDAPPAAIGPRPPPHSTGPARTAPPAPAQHRPGPDRLPRQRAVSPDPAAEPTSAGPTRG